AAMKTNAFQFFALVDDGAISDPAEADVVQDPSATKPLDAACSVTKDCVPQPHEICDNHVDDTCDGLVDQYDPQCSSCTDDMFSPNDDPYKPLPELLHGSYDIMKLCPGRNDFFA